MWFVYILKCEDDSFYTGISNDPDRRFSEHKDRKGGHYTSSHKVVERVYLEKCEDRSTALKRERQIKGWKREKKLQLINLSA